MRRQSLLIGMLIVVMGLCGISMVMAEETMNVTFVSCCLPEGFFWPKVDAVMRAAAEDLHIQVEIVYANMDHLKMLDLAKEVVTRPNPPDYLIVDNYKLQGGEMIATADAAKVKVFLMANGLTDEQTVQSGKPREKYPTWIGELTPDNYQAGSILAKHVIDNALQAGVKAADGKLQLVGIGGDLVTPAGVQRKTGLENVVAEYPNVNLLQVFTADWQQAKAQERVTLALDRYSELGAIWAANDEMALGALDAVIAAGKTPGKDVFLGGVNWKREALDNVANGKMAASVGGHFMIGAWTLVLLYDYHHGKDFLDEGTQLRKPMFDVLDATNVQQYLAKFGDENWGKIDFTRFSKVLNSEVKQYDFSIKQILQ